MNRAGITVYHEGGIVLFRKEPIKKAGPAILGQKMEPRTSHKSTCIRF